MRRVIALAVGLALALTSMALAVTSGTYTGTSSQKLGGVHYPISFRVSGSKITGGVYKANYHGHAGCSAASDGTNRWGQGIKGGRAVKITHGKFNANDRIYPGDYLKLSGSSPGAR